ncbi:MAG TPA: thiamine-monophosphate kinase [Acidisarcina sp.]|nr:thiamine-monophosphate kinase [Acidisarcina sp.]
MIAAIRQRAASGKAATGANGRNGGALRLGIGDDCAILRPPAGEEIVVTTDLSLEHVHFRRDWHPAESAGHRCLARGLSDVAAMGATPLAAFLSLAIPPELTRKAGRATTSWMERFLDGFLRLAAQHRVPLAGGDLAQSPRILSRASNSGASNSRASNSLVIADIILLGSVPRGRALLRSTARAGDTIYVTGSLGGAAAELLALERSPRRFRHADASQLHPHLYPQPRLQAASRIRAAKMATAAIDISDGLSTDLAHLCEESALAAEIDADAIPVHVMANLAEMAGLAPSALALALHGGEDYELLFTAAPRTRVPARIAGVPVRAIGRMVNRRTRQPLISLVSGGHSQPLNPGGWEHFR